MNLTKMELITIIALDSLEHSLIKDLKECGVKGYTIMEARGEGLSTIRNSDWEGRNIRIDAIISEEILEKVFKLLSDKYFQKYKMIAFSKEVRVLRKEKFV